MDNLPLFPIFKPLELSDKASIDTITKQFSPYSDYNFASLWSYNTGNSLIISNLFDNLIIRFEEYTTNAKCYSFLGHHHTLETIEHLLDLSEKEKVGDTLKLVPHSSLENHLLQDTPYVYYEDRDNFDYILSVEEVATLRSEKYHTHRNHINKFDKSYPHCEIKVLTLDEKVRGEMLDVFYRWEKGKGYPRSETEHELLALTRLLEHHSSFQLIAIGIYDGQKLIGFSLSDTEHPRYAQVHFAKSDPEYKQVYYKLMHTLAQMLLPQGIAYINIEQDLGIAGLRYSKEQWNPSSYLKKYTVSRKKNL